MVYANINSTKFKLDNYSIGNGTYTIETYYNNSLLCSSQLVVEGNIQYHAPLFQLSGLVKDDNYKLFKNITIGTTVHDFFSTTKNNDVLEIYTKDSNLVYNKSNPDTIMKIATGMYVTFYDDDLNKVKYTFSVKGDANGDGIISSKDYVVIRKHLMETAIITDTAELMASDYNMDNNITSKDYVQIRKYLMSS